MPFPEGAGIELRHPFGLRMPHAAHHAPAARLLAGDGAFVPSSRRQREEDRNLAIVMNGLRRSREPRQIVVDVWGAREDIRQVVREWRTGDWMRSQIRRWNKKAKALADDGWRDLVPRGRPRSRIGRGLRSKSMPVHRDMNGIRNGIRPHGRSVRRAR